MSVIINGDTGITTPAETVQGALTTTGNTILGDATTDTLNVGAGGLVKDASGNVGIGTASPSSKLHVSSSSGGGGAGGQIELTNTYAGVPSPNKYIRVNDSGILDIVNSGYTATTMSVTDAGLFQFNSGYGSVATAYGCRAWVNFNGTGTVAIRASGNVSSITDRGVGRYTVNFTTAMVDVNYSTSTGVRKLDTNEDNNMVITLGATNTAYSTTAVALTTGFATSGSNQDAELACVAVFR
jgi:hypothetical protein